jgi:hypothetical protein
MERNILIIFLETEWNGIADEMNFMSLFGQDLTQFSGYGAATTEGRITGDSDVHKYSV